MNLSAWRVLACLLLSVLAQASLAAGQCSPYSNVGGNSGKVWFNEYYFGPAATDFLEVYSRNLKVTASTPQIWSNWYIRVYSKSGNSVATDTYKLDSYTTACTVSGNRTYIMYANPQVSLDHNDAMVVVFDGPPDAAGTGEIDALVYSNETPPTPYNGSVKYYTPACDGLRSALDSQLSQALAGGEFNGQNLLILNNFGTKDIARLPDGTGAWDETALSGSGTSYTQCITNDPVDIVKSYTWSPTYTTATSNGTVDPGAVVTLTVAATNRTKATMNGVVITDPLPSGLTYAGVVTASTGASASCGGTPTTCVLTAPAALAPEASASMTFQATVSSAAAFAGATIQNTARQSGGTALDPAPSADALVTVASGVTLEVAASNQAPVAGQPVTFTVSAFNATSYPMAGAVITIAIPPGLTFDASSAPAPSAGGTVTCSATSCQWTLPSPLAAAQAATLTFRAIATGEPGQAVTVTATQTAGSALTTKPFAGTTVTIAGAVSGFNACHNFAQSQCTHSTGRLYTRVAGVPFTMEIAALKSDGSVATSYIGAGGAAKAVKVELLNADDGNRPVATQTATFPAGNTTGRIQITWPALNTAFKNLLVRVTDATGTTPVVSVSSDAFSVRPAQVTVATNATANPTNTASTPVIMAGMPFTITANSDTPGYTGTLAVDRARLATGNLQLGSLYHAATEADLTLVVNAVPAPTRNAAYDEVGHFTANPGAFRDDSFTAIDQPAGCRSTGSCDCLASPSGNSDVANSADASGRLGCGIGNTGAVTFARFIPHHFTLATPPTFNPGHSSCGFTYMDQPFTLDAAIEARNARGSTTRNYQGAVATGVVQVQVENADNGVPISAGRLVRPSVPAWIEGRYAVSLIRFSRRAAGPDGPFDQLAIGVAVLDEAGLADAWLRPTLRNRDMDAATSGCTADSLGIANGTCTAVNLIPTPSKTTRMRFGRLHLGNVHGSELLPLRVPMTAQYYSGNGFVTNTLDSCTALLAAHVELRDHRPASFAVSMNAANVQTGGTLRDGVGAVNLSKPSPKPPGKSAVNVCVNLGPDTLSQTAGVTAPACVSAASAGMPWLQGRYSETAFDDDPVARATFGVHRSGPIIYMREIAVFQYSTAF